MWNFLFSALLPFNVFIIFPWMAYVVAGVFLVATYVRRRLMILPAAAAWIFYGIYETYMQQWSEHVIAPIRIDLLVVGWSLYLISLVGVFFIVKK